MGIPQSCLDEERPLYAAINNHGIKDGLNRSVVLGHIADAENTFYFEMYRHLDALMFNIHYEGKKIRNESVKYLRKSSDGEHRHLFAHIVCEVLSEKWNHTMPENEKNDVMAALYHICGTSGGLTKAA